MIESAAVDGRVSADRVASASREPATGAVGTSWVLVWAAALLALFLFRLGAAPLFDVDEGAFSEATREMLASGDWGHTTLNGGPRFDKPILVYWLQAASVSAFGLNEFAVRLPSALCAWAWCLVLAAFAWRRWGATAAMASATLLATSFGVLVIGRASTADALLNLWLALAGLDLWRHLESGARAPLRRAGAWVGLGLLTKGPVALLVPGAAVLLWAASRRDGRALVRAASDPWAWLWMLAIAAPWYGYALHRHGMAFVDGFLMRHNVERYTGTLQGHGGSIAYYLVVLPLLWLPWTPLLVAVLARWRRLWRDPVTRYLLGWAAFVVLFFSLSGTKLPHYVLYGATPLALLMGTMLADAGRRLRLAIGACLLLLLAVNAALPALLVRHPAWIRDPLYRALVGGAPAPTLLVVGCALAGAIVLALLLWRRPADPAAARTADAHGFALRSGASAFACALTLTGLATPWWGEALQGPVRRLAQGTASMDLVQWSTNLPSFSFHRRRETPARDPQPGEMALARLDRLPPDARVERLREERGLAIVQRLR